MKSGYRGSGSPAKENNGDSQIDIDESNVEDNDQQRSSGRIPELLMYCCAGGFPVLIYTTARSVTLCHSPFSDANAPPPGANKQTARHPK